MKSLVVKYRSLLLVKTKQRGEALGPIPIDHQETAWSGAAETSCLGFSSD